MAFHRLCAVTFNLPLRLIIKLNLMKQVFLLFALFSYINIAAAQGPGGGAPVITGRVSGVIIDSLTQKPVDYATVALGRSGATKTTNGSLTDEKGSFKIENIAPGTYRLTIAFLGYQTKIIDPVSAGDYSVYTVAPIEGNDVGAVAGGDGVVTGAADKEFVAGAAG